METEEKEKQSVEEPEVQAPAEEQAEAPAEPVEDKFNVQVSNLLQELCDLVKALKVEEAQEEAEEDVDDAAQFDELLDE